MLRTSVLGGPDAMEEIRAEWQHLQEHAPTATPFQSWEWQSAWLRHFRRMKRPHVVVVREGKDVVGIMPLTRTLGPWRTIRSMGCGISDYLHPLAIKGHEATVSDAVFEHLRELAKVDLIDLHQLRESQPLSARASRRAEFEQATCLLLDLPSTFDTYVAGLSKSLRYDVRRLEKLQNVEVHPVEEDEIAEGLQILFEQHKLRWRKRGLPGVFIGRVQRFHNDWAHQAIGKGWLWLSILKLEREPIGAIYAMRFGDTCYYYQAGFDPSKGSISPGTLLVAETIRRAIGEGLQHFDFLRGDEPYKRRWKPQHELKNYRLLHARNPHRGTLGASWNEAGSKVEAKLRQRFEGKSLVR